MSIDTDEQIDVSFETEKAKKYNLVFHNDEVTPFDFVIFLLVEVIGKDEETAYHLTMSIHNSDAAAVEQGLKPEMLDLQGKIKEIVEEEGMTFKTSIEEA